MKEQHISQRQPQDINVMITFWLNRKGHKVRQIASKFNLKLSSWHANHLHITLMAAHVQAIDIIHILKLHIN